MGVFLGALFVEPDVLKSQSVGSRLHAIAITAVVVAAFDVWFSRRMGLTIDEGGLTLHYAFHRKRVPWADVHGFEWKRWKPANRVDLDNVQRRTIPPYTHRAAHARGREAIIYVRNVVRRLTSEGWRSR
jgi:Bacterial PH domain